MPPASFYFHIILCSQGIHEVVYDKDLEDRQAQGISLFFSPSSLAAHQAVVARLNLKSRSSLEAGLWRQSQGCLCWWFLFGRNDVQQKNHYQQYYIPIIWLYQSQIWSYEHFGQFVANICRNHTSEDLKKTSPRCRVHMGWHFFWSLNSTISLPNWWLINGYNMLWLYWYDVLFDHL